MKKELIVKDCMMLVEVLERSIEVRNKYIGCVDCEDCEFDMDEGCNCLCEVIFKIEDSLYEYNGESKEWGLEDKLNIIKEYKKGSRESKIWYMDLMRRRLDRDVVNEMGIWDIIKDYREMMGIIDEMR